jgi:hypothetical protein
MLPRLFMIWDEDGNGFLDEGELFAGLGRYCTARSISIDRKAVLKILSEVDDNDDRLLDTREFAIFFARFAELVDCCISDLATFMIEQLRQREDGVMKDESGATIRGSFFSNAADKPVVKDETRRTSWMGLISRVKAASNDDSGTTSTATTSASEGLDPQQLELQLDEKIQKIHELEFKLRQREQAIEHLEDALKVKDHTIDMLREQVDSQPPVEFNGGVAGDIAAGPLCETPEEKEDNEPSLKERQLQSENVFASIRTSFSTTTV